MLYYNYTMIGILRKPRFWTNLIAIAFSTFLVANFAFGFNNPTQNPVGGTAPFQVDATSGNVGIGMAPTAGEKLSVFGNVQWSGNLNAGSVPWARLTSVPVTTCAPGALMVGVPGGVVTCLLPSCPALVGAPAGFSDCIDDATPNGINSLTAGFGLTATPANPIGAGVAGTLTVNPVQVQQRVTQTCVGTGAIRQINQDGTVLCQAVP